MARHQIRTDGEQLDDRVQRRLPPALAAAPVDKIEDEEGLQEGEQEDEGVARGGGGEEGEEEGGCGMCVWIMCMCDDAWDGPSEHDKARSSFILQITNIYTSIIRTRDVVCGASCRLALHVHAFTHVYTQTHRHAHTNIHIYTHSHAPVISAPEPARMSLEHLDTCVCVCIFDEVLKRTQAAGCLAHLYTERIDALCVISMHVCVMCVPTYLADRGHERLLLLFGRGGDGGVGVWGQEGFAC